MLIIKITSGLGNQMFQYAFGRALSLRRKEDLFLDTNSYKAQSIKDTPRRFILDQYKIIARIANPETIAPYWNPFRIFLKRVWKKIFPKSDYVYQTSLATSPRTYLEGHFATEKYFKEYRDVLLIELQLKDALGEAAEKISRMIALAAAENWVPVSIHIRRGDYISNDFAASYHGTIEKDYYEKAISYISSKFDKVKFFIFSDEIEWAKTHLSLNEEAVFVSNSGIKDYEELHLMSLCSHNIIANSSFSWWGAWLNPNLNKIVVAPKKWVKKENVNTDDIIPTEWITL